MNSLKNISYIFIPFSFNKKDDNHADFHYFVAALDKSSAWEQVHDKIKYMLKYVADKINSYDNTNCRCFHYELNAFSREKFGIAAEDEWFKTNAHPFNGHQENIRFRILSVHLYCFSTTVGIIAFKLNFEKDDPIWISNAQYYLKKVSKEKIFIDGTDSQTTLLDISKCLVAEFSSICEFEFFYYANPYTERANVLTYLEVEPQENFKKELFYLRRCYSDDYVYAEDEKTDSAEIFATSKATVWGVSPEAAVCLACSGYGLEEFVHKTFFHSFNQEYLFMYVLLLHQKYVLYMFLSKIGVGTYNDLDTLEEYRHQLYEFETDFVFSCITEVPQYQMLYDKLTQAFSLEKMYNDVHEPLTSLREVRRETAENNQKKRDDSVNGALLVLSVLSFFSALIDSFDFFDSFLGWFCSGTVIRIVQCVFIALIFSILIYVLVSLFKSKKGK